MGGLGGTQRGLGGTEVAVGLLCALHTQLHSHSSLSYKNKSLGSLLFSRMGGLNKEWTFIIDLFSNIQNRGKRICWIFQLCISGKIRNKWDTAQMKAGSVDYCWKHWHCRSAFLECLAKAKISKAIDAWCLDKRDICFPWNQAVYMPHTALSTAAHIGQNGNAF